MDDTTPPPAPPPITYGDRLRKTFVAPTVVAVAMILLSLVGVGVTDYNRHWARPYWLSMVPVFGILSAWLAYRKQLTGAAVAGLVGRQALHWSGVFVVFLVLFSYLREGEISVEATGFSAILLISLSSFLAGVHFDWHFFIVAALQLAMAWLLLRVQSSIWIVLPIGMGIIGVLIAGLWLRARRV